jgi:hypothetical protein
MSNKYVEVCNETGRLLNIILWDGITEYSRPGRTIIPIEECPNEIGFGWTKTESGWEQPPEQEEEQI